MTEKRPNIIVIIVDNMPAQALGCYGNKDAQTPNLDRLATQGIKFNNTYCANGVCSPSRASLLTGLMPSQHGIHFALPDNWDWYPENFDAVARLRTLPQTLKDNGYKTGLVGKFHMGSPYTPQHGFDVWVPDEHGHTIDFFDMHYVENGEVHHYDGHATDFWTDKAIEFVNINAGGKKPFFLYVAYNAPYGDGFAMQGDPKMPFGSYFKDKPMESLPREAVSKRNIDFVMRWTGTDLPGFDFSDNLTAQNNLPRMRNYFAQISHMDDGVGRLMQTLQENGLDDDTIILFTADHGISMGRNGVWGVSPYAFPAVGYRQCFNIPMIVKHTNHVTPLQESNQMVMQTDWFRTLLDYIGLNEIKIDDSPGRSMAPLLKGDQLTGNFDAAFYEQEELRAVRTQRWSFFKYFAGSENYQFDDELYDLASDPGEDHNLATDPAYADVIAELSTRIDTFFAKNANPKYDLWNGGTAMAYYYPPVQGAVWQNAYGTDWKPEFPK
ncbi:MAG: sulfatase-like hydrolase/transferase [Anaerolineaceae bacterium]|nr:MAG: sulfatase-like hydrolase/transferase [Anaerolineaceae bacterium]